MQNGSINKASRVERAQGRLDSAIDRLEAALTARPAPTPDDAAESEQAAKLASLSAENDHLRQVNADATRRLDDAIQRLGRVLAD